MFLTNRGTSEYYFPYTQIRAVAHISARITNKRSSSDAYSIPHQLRCLQQLIFTLGPQELSQDDPSSLGQTFRTVADNGQGLGHSEPGLLEHGFFMVLLLILLIRFNPSNEVLIRPRHVGRRIHHIRTSGISQRGLKV